MDNPTAKDLFVFENGIHLLEPDRETFDLKWWQTNGRMNFHNSLHELKFCARKAQADIELRDFQESLPSANSEYSKAIDEHAFFLTPLNPPDVYGSIYWRDHISGIYPLN